MQRARHLRGGAVALGLVLWIAGAGPGTALAQDIQILDLMTNELIYDPVSDRIYASVPSAAGPELGDTITVIDPFTGTIESSVFIGSEPDPLAVSDNGQFLYVGLDSTGSVRRYDIATATPGLEISLGSGPYGMHIAEDIEVLPGNPNTFAVARKRSDGWHTGVAIYDNEVMRPTTTPMSWANSQIEFSDSASLLYGADNVTLQGNFRQISITDQGAEVIALAEGLITYSSFTTIEIEFEKGIIYSTTGPAIDPTALVPLGTYAAEGPVEADPARGRVYFLDGTTLQSFNLERFVLESSVPIQGISGEPRSLIRWGADSLAFNTSGGQVFLISRVPPTTPSLVCEVELNNTVYAEGEAVIANSFRLVNQTVQTVAVEAQLWFDRPDQAPYHVRGILPAGSFDLAPGADQELGPVTLATVPPGLPAGRYGFSCRLIDPVTADHLALDVDTFELR